MPEHVAIEAGEIHICNDFVYADATAREAASLASTDVGKIAKQTDTGAYYVLVHQTGPIWVRLSVGAVVNAQTGTSYTILAKDRGKLVTHTNAAAIAVTLPQANTTGFGADWFYYTQNRGAGAVTITPTTSTIDGAATLVLNQNEGVLIMSDGTNYFTVRGKQAGGAAPGGSAGGALGGTYPNPTVKTVICIACSDETTALTTGTAKVTFRMPHAMTLTDIRASLSTTQTSGSIFTVDVNEGGSTIISTKITIDNGEKTSTTAATPPVISDSALADDAEITIDIDQVGDGTAKGLKVYLIGTRS